VLFPCAMYNTQPEGDRETEIRDRGAPVLTPLSRLPSNEVYRRTVSVLKRFI
jgi:hypothetical protein